MKYLLICALLIVLVVCLYPYLKAEILTLKYGNEFEKNNLGMVEDISYCKVIEYKGESAEVIYVCKGEMSVLVKYQKDKDWSVQTWECIWSGTGSADRFKWLLYR